MKQEQIAVFGGSFDPPTLQHEAIVSACLDLPDIDYVAVMPSGGREDKQFRATDQQRLDMISRMKPLQNDDRVIFETAELQLPTPIKTWRTVRALQALRPATRHWFVFGADSYWDMPNWEHGRELQQTLPMLLVPRDDQRWPLPPETNRVRHLVVGKQNVYGISSTRVRELIRVGDLGGCATLLSVDVADYVFKERVYDGLQ